MARSTAPRFRTGSVPGSARSMAEAWVLGGAPKAVAEPLNILASVDSWACVSMPITPSQPRTRGAAPISDSRGHTPVPVGGLLQRVRSVQQPWFLEVVADELQADGQAGLAEARAA